MRYTSLFFDLDDTLYPNDTGLWEMIRQRMSLYMLERLKLPMQSISALRKQYFETYGTTLRGLQIHHSVDPDDYLAYVHDIPVDEYLKPQPTLRQILLSLPQGRWIFTNSDAAHAQRVLMALRLEGCFNGIIDIRATHFSCKPEVQAYQYALAFAGERVPESCVLFEDSLVNLRAAKELGFRTVLINSNRQTNPAADHSLISLLTLPEEMPELWEM
ncbi:MAG: pyrimidine 5'-nucleotidase [Chloroflexi bacterium]|jgi:putative hydrolase of the HAD superfamily|nr:pyrimidine 5'-nucleotidase [Chloroflexota bacterium]